MYSLLPGTDLAKTLVVEFEEFVLRPETYIDKISGILKTSRRNSFDEIMKSVHLPRDTVETLGRDAFYKKYRNDLSDRYVILLDRLENVYATLRSDIKASQSRHAQ